MLKRLILIGIAASGICGLFLKVIEMAESIFTAIKLKLSNEIYR